MNAAAPGAVSITRWRDRSTFFNPAPPDVERHGSLAAFALSLSPEDRRVILAGERTARYLELAAQATRHVQAQ